MLAWLIYLHFSKLADSRARRNKEFSDSFQHTRPRYIQDEDDEDDAESTYSEKAFGGKHSPSQKRKTQLLKMSKRDYGTPTHDIMTEMIKCIKWRKPPHYHDGVSTIA